MAEVGRRLGLPLMPWQLQVIEVALELDPDGSYHYDEVVMTVPRQSGKTALVMAMAVHRLVVLSRTMGRQRMTYTAQLRQKARNKLERDFADILRGARGFKEVPHARARPERPTEWRLSLNNGAENIQFGQGNYLQIDAPSRTGGHGDTLDVGVIDEAFAHQDDTIEAGMEPSMATRARHQLVVLSTAGDATSFYLWRKVLAGRHACETGEHGRTAYLEWSAPDDADPADPATWWACSPALGHTQPPRFLEGQWDKAVRGGPEGINKFRRAYLNQWPQIPVLDEGRFHVIPADQWAACADSRSVMHDPVAFALDVTPDRTTASIAVAGAGSDPDTVQVEVPFTGSVGDAVRELARMVAEWKPLGVFIDGASPAAALLDELEQLKVKVTVTTGPEHARACGLFTDRIRERTLRHRNEDSLQAAIAGAGKRPLGDAWAWSRKKSNTDISPLVAATLAAWGFAGHRKRRSRVVNLGEYV